MEEGRFQPVVIRNRDIPVLADVLAIMQDVRMTEEQKAWQRDRLTNITPHLTGMPGGGGLPKGLGFQPVAAGHRLHPPDDQRQQRDDRTPVF